MTFSPSKLTTKITPNQIFQRHSMHLKKKEKQRGTKCPARSHLWLFQHLVSAGPLREQIIHAIAGSPPVLGGGHEGLLGVCVRHVEAARFLLAPVQVFFRLLQGAAAALGEDPCRGQAAGHRGVGRLRPWVRPALGGHGLGLQQVRDGEAEAPIQVVMPSPYIQGFVWVLFHLLLAQVEKQRPGPLLEWAPDRWFIQIHGCMKTPEVTLRKSASLQKTSGSPRTQSMRRQNVRLPCGVRTHRSGKRDSKS